MAPVHGHLPLDVVSSAAAVHGRRAAAATGSAAARKHLPSATAEQGMHELVMEVRGVVCGALC